ncbi:MAG TPA: immunoglobulin domain-containing protein [Saprospiraceae bacterium]|nr:immunoglobulin domain-containing protein [Saprospiraceae bacterium]
MRKLITKLILIVTTITAIPFISEGKIILFEDYKFTFIQSFLSSAKLDSIPCTNMNMFPPILISLGATNGSGLSQNVTECQFAGEYYGVTNVLPGNNYSFISSNSSDYITVHSGSFNGPVVISSLTPVNLIGVSGEDLYIHTNSDSLCGTDFNCRTSIVQCSSCIFTGCTNLNNYPDSLISLYNTNAIQTITTCQNGGEYYDVTGIQSGNNYLFSSSFASDYITVHEGSFDGPIIIFGNTPLAVLGASGADLFIHTSIDSICGTDTICRTTTAQCTSCIFAGCNNLSISPNVSISLDSTNLSGIIQNITDCQYAGEYYHVTSVKPGSNYSFASSNPTDYLTVHQGSYNGPVVSLGTTPISVFAASGIDLFIHTNTDSLCGVDTTCRISTAQCTSCSIGCINISNYPSDTIISLDFTNGSGALQIITDCNYAGEYYGITGVLTGNDYSFTSSESTDYITIRSGSFNGPIVLAGFTPLNLIGASGTDLYVHVNTDSICGTEETCRTTTVQCTSCHFYGCTNFIQNPDTLISLLTTSGALYITNCQLGGQYYGVTGVQVGYNYQFASSASNDYITVHEGAFNGNIIAAGITPVTINNASGADLFIHTNIDAYCGADSICRISTAQCISCIFAGCTNSIDYPKDTIISLDSTNSSGAIQLITDCNYAGEYYVLTDIKTGNNYQFASSTQSDYITIHSGSYNGPIIKYGKTPVNIISLAETDLFVHINSDTLCGTDNVCRSSTVQCTSCCEPVTIITNPIDQSIFKGEKATFSSTVNGTPPFVIEWFKNNSLIIGAKDLSYTTPKLFKSDDGNQYFSKISNCSGSKSAITNTATVTITSLCDPVVITQQPLNQIGNVGNTATFTVAVNGTSPVNYIWYKLKNTLSLIQNSNSPSYTTPPLSLDDDGSIYFCFISNCAESETVVTKYANLSVTKD